MVALCYKNVIIPILNYMRDNKESTIMDIADGTGIDPLMVLGLILLLENLCIVMLTPIELSAENERKYSCLYSLML